MKLKWTHLVGLPRLHGRVQFVQHLEQFLVALVAHLAALQHPNNFLFRHSIKFHSKQRPFEWQSDQLIKSTTDAVHSASNRARPFIPAAIKHKTFNDVNVGRMNEMHQLSNYQVPPGGLDCPNENEWTTFSVLKAREWMKMSKYHIQADRVRDSGTLNRLLSRLTGNKQNGNATIR